MCPYCGEDWADQAERHHNCDVRVSEDDVFLVWLPCCLDNQLEVEDEGFEAVHGISIEQVASEICGREVLEVAEHATVVGRLVVFDPAVKVASASHPVDTVKSPKGWRDEVFDFIDRHHRHHDAPQGHKFSVAVDNGPVRVGMAVVGRPVSRMLAAAEPQTLEVTRVCTHGAKPLTKNAASKLYAACVKKARSIRAKKLITYTLFEIESGHSLIASGWTPTHLSPGGSWGRTGRPRQDAAPTCRKVRWEKGLDRNTQAEIEKRKIFLSS